MWVNVRDARDKIFKGELYYDNITTPFLLVGRLRPLHLGQMTSHRICIFRICSKTRLQKQNELKEELNILPETSEEDILHKKSQLEYLEAIFTLQLSIAGDHEVES